jgi:hypothetical protein
MMTEAAKIWTTKTYNDQLRVPGVRSRRPEPLPGRRSSEGARRTLLTSHEEWLRALKVLAEKELGPQMPVESFTSTANPHRKI